MDIKRKISTNITDQDITKYLGTDARENIIKYSDLANVSDIYEILPKPRCYKIVLIEDKYNSGHWTCLLRYGDTIEWFDSYGLNPSGELKFIPKIIRRMLGEDQDYLMKLLKQVKNRRVIWNKKRFQKLEKGISTCGRWCIFRILTCMELFFTLEDFITFVEKQKEEFGMTGDEIVTNWVSG
jgi:hypothetical protein